MVRLSDLPEYEREHLLAKSLPPLGPPVWVTAQKPLSEMRVALITTAGLHYRDDPAFAFADATFRPIDNEEDAGDLVMSHSSVNFDRTGFAEDVNIVFPLERFKELEAQGRWAAWRRSTTALWALACRRLPMSRAQRRLRVCSSKIRLTPFS